jgi:hypothetical protein
MFEFFYFVFVIENQLFFSKQPILLIKKKDRREMTSNKEQAYGL